MNFEGLDALWCFVVTIWDAIETLIYCEFSEIFLFEFLLKIVCGFDCWLPVMNRWLFIGYYEYSRNINSLISYVRLGLWYMREFWSLIFIGFDWSLMFKKMSKLSGVTRVWLLVLRISPFCILPYIYFSGNINLNGFWNFEFVNSSSSNMILLLVENWWFRICLCLKLHFSLLLFLCC